VRLFERVGRRLLLAPAGERLLRSARAVLEELERAEEEVGRKGTARSLIRLTTQCNTVYHWLPPLLRRFPAAASRGGPGSGRGRHERSDPGARLGRDRPGDRVPAGARAAREPAAALPRRDGGGDAAAAPAAPVPFVSAQDLGPEHLILYSIPPEANLVFREVLVRPESGRSASRTSS
jgi:hypothetical protein